MKTLRALAWSSVAVAFGTVLLGSWTRINGAGMTCPDWPLCHGKLIPSLADGTLWEWSHRFLALCLIPLVLGVLLAAWRERGRSVLVARSGLLVAALFLVQVALGAATVHLGNSPISVVLHWGTAMAFTAALVALAIFAREGDENGPPTRLTAALAIGLTIAFATMCIGAYVSSSGAGLACLSIPGCAGSIVLFTPGQEVQMLHRVFAALTLLACVVVFAWAWIAPTSARVRIAVSCVLALLFVQILLGLMNVAFHLPMDLREAHAANATLFFLTFVIATLFSLLDGVPSNARVARTA